MRDSIFISYRRSDSRYQASRIYEHVERAVGRRKVFMDIDSIPVGSEFPAVLTQALSKALVVIAVIGDNWLSSKTETGERRLDNEHDFVRREIAQALANREIVVIPVLLDDAKLPGAAELPPDLQSLPTRNAITLRHGSWNKDMEGLLRPIRAELRPLARARHVQRAKLAAAAISAIAFFGSAPLWWPKLESSLSIVSTAVASEYVRWRNGKSDVDIASERDRASWQTAEALNSIEGYKTYRKVQPNGSMAAEAEQRIKRLEEAQKAEAARQEALRIAELNKRKQEEAERAAQAAEREKAAEAERRRKEYEHQDNTTFETALRVNERGALQAYLDQFPEGRHRDAAAAGIKKIEQEATERADAAAWERATQLNRLSEYKEYLRLWPSGRRVEEARNHITGLEALADRLARSNDEANPAKLRELASDSKGTEFEAAATSRLNDVEHADKAAWDAAEKGRGQAGFADYLQRWPFGDYRNEAQSRLEAIEQAAKEWARISGKNDEAGMEAFLQRDYIADFEPAAVAELVALRRNSHRGGNSPYVKVLTADEMAAAIDGATIRFPRNGVLVRFNKGAALPASLKVKRNYFSSISKEIFVVEGGFTADVEVDGNRMSISGLGAVQESRVDKTGSLLLLQLLGTDRTEQDLATKDRLYATVSIIRGPHGIVCDGTPWAFVLGKLPSAQPEACEIVRPFGSK